MCVWNLTASAPARGDRVDVGVRRAQAAVVRLGHFGDDQARLAGPDFDVAESKSVTRDECATERRGE